MGGKAARGAIAPAAAQLAVEGLAVAHHCDVAGGGVSGKSLSPGRAGPSVIR
jgi:hypothetical protein